MKTIGGDSDSGRKKKKKDDETFIQNLKEGVEGKPTLETEKPSYISPESKEMRKDIYSIDEKGQAQERTIFDRNIIENAPDKMLNKPNIEINTYADVLRRSKLTPQEKYNEDKEKEYAKGEYGKFSEQELADRLRAEGKNVVGGEATPLEQPKTALDSIAQFGVSIPVTIANFVGKGLKLLGVKNAESITPEQFASTDIGKTLGLGITGAMAAGVVSFGTGLISAGGAKGIIGANLVKSKLATGGIGKLLLGGGAIATVNKIMGDSKQAMSGSLQTMDLINDAMELGALSPIEAVSAYNEIESDMNELYSKIHFTNSINPISWLSGGKDAEVDIANARLQVQMKRLALMQSLTQPQNI